MRKSQISSGLACASFISLTSFATADKIDPETSNTVPVPVTILDDYPQCDGPGAIAFRVDFHLENLDYVFGSSDLSLTGQVDSTGAVSRDASSEACSVIQRRGTERIQVSVACTDEYLGQSDLSVSDLEQTQLSLSGQFTACQSPFRFTILDSDWRARFSTQDAQVDITGRFSPQTDGRCKSKSADNGPMAVMRYAPSGDIGYVDPFGLVSRSGTAGLGRNQTFAVINVFGLPIPQSNGSATALEAITSANLLLSEDGQGGCKDRACEMPDWLGLGSFGMETRLRPAVCE